MYEAGVDARIIFVAGKAQIPCFQIRHKLVRRHVEMDRRYADKVPVHRPEIGASFIKFADRWFAFHAHHSLGLFIQFIAVDAHTLPRQPYAG